MRQYREPDADNARWEGFAFRAGDIVIDAPSKSGTTWTQLLVALLVFDGPDFPGAVGELSPWMEQKIRSKEEVHAIFEVQDHRRFIKSHTPLDGIPLVDGVRYVCVGRDPRDAAISMIHHRDNMNRDRFFELVGRPVDAEVGETMSTTDYFDRWVDNDEFPGWNVRFLAHHYRTFWDRRNAENVALFHFDHYLTDLPGELRRLAAHLEVPLNPDRAVQLATHATLDAARSRASAIAPEAHVGLWKDSADFFREGSSGQWHHEMTAEHIGRYRALMADLLPPDLDSWLHPN